MHAIQRRSATVSLLTALLLTVSLTAGALTAAPARAAEQHPTPRTPVVDVSTDASAWSLPGWGAHSHEGIAQTFTLSDPTTIAEVAFRVSALITIPNPVITTDATVTIWAGDTPTADAVHHVEPPRRHDFRGGWNHFPVSGLTLDAGVWTVGVEVGELGTFTNRGTTTPVFPEQILFVIEPGFYAGGSMHRGYYYDGYGRFYSRSSYDTHMRVYTDEPAPVVPEMPAVWEDPVQWPQIQPADQRTVALPQPRTLEPDTGSGPAAVQMLTAHRHGVWVDPCEVFHAARVGGGPCAATPLSLNEVATAVGSEPAWMNADRLRAEPTGQVSFAKLHDEMNADRPVLIRLTDVTVNGIHTADAYALVTGSNADAETVRIHVFLGLEHGVLGEEPIPLGMPYTDLVDRAEPITTSLLTGDRTLALTWRWDGTITNIHPDLDADFGVVHPDDLVNGPAANATAIYGDTALLFAMTIMAIQSQGLPTPCGPPPPSGADEIAALVDVLEAIDPDAANDSDELRDVLQDWWTLSALSTFVGHLVYTGPGGLGPATASSTIATTADIVLLLGNTTIAGYLDFDLDGFPKGFDMALNGALWFTAIDSGACGI